MHPYLKNILLAVILPAIVTASIIHMVHTTPKWTVEPVESGTTGTMADWKWRSCLNHRGSRSCGSPMEYHEALWWSATQGGTKVEQMNQRVNVIDGYVFDNVIVGGSHSIYIGDINPGESKTFTFSKKEDAGTENK